jgi:hypothetical protein
MHLFSRLFQAARTWRNSGRPKTAKRSAVDVEQLDHRQLLSVNFTGNVATDFPATTTPTPQFPTGVILFNAQNTPGIITPNTAFYGNLIPTSGFAISGIAVSYDPTDDTLSVGFEQPPAGTASDPTGDVIAGDADDNGNAGNVNPAVSLFDPPTTLDFTEFPALEGQGVQMYAFLDLADSGSPDIVAGFSPNQPFYPPGVPPNQSNTGANPQAPKPYEVAQAVPVAPMNPPVGPGFGTLLPNNTGNVYLANQAAHPNLEFSITNFSQLYLSETGHALTPSSVIGIGAFAGSPYTPRIGDAFFPENTFTLAQATVPVPPVNPQPSPPILINPHEHRIIDTGHRDLVRVSIFGTSGFPVSQINPATVELDGVKSIAHITRKIQRDEFPFQTYVFVADQLKLPPGLTTATLTGQTNSGVTFETQKDVLNLPHSALAFGTLKKYMGNASYYERLAKLEAKNPSIANTASTGTVTLASRNPKAQGAAAIKVEYTPKVSAAGHAAKAEAVKVRPVISLKKSEAAPERSNVSVRVRHSMDHFLSSAG